MYYIYEIFLIIAGTHWKPLILGDPLDDPIFSNHSIHFFFLFSLSAIEKLMLAQMHEPQIYQSSNKIELRITYRYISTIDWIYASTKNQDSSRR